MAHHATQTLSFDPPLPSFAVVETDDVEHAHAVIRGGGSAHVSSRAVAERVMARLGMPPERIEDLLHYCLTGRFPDRS